MQQFKSEFFKALANPLRIQILEILAQGDRGVNEIQQLAESEGLRVSQQLTVLRSRNMVTSIKNGNRVIYSLQDPLIVELLDVARKIFNNQLSEKITILDRLNYTDKTE